MQNLLWIGLSVLYFSNCLLCFQALLQNFPYYAPIMLYNGPLCSIRTWPTDCFIRMYDCSIRVSWSFNFSWQGTAKIWRAKLRPWLRHWKTDVAFEGFADFRGMLLYNMPIMLVLCSKLAYYASIMLEALACLLCLKLCRHNRHRPNYGQPILSRDFYGWWNHHLDLWHLYGFRCIRLVLFFSIKVNSLVWLHVFLISQHGCP